MWVYVTARPAVRMEFMFWQVGWTDQIIENSHTPQQSVSRPTDVLPTTRSDTMSLYRDNVSIKTQKYVHLQRFWNVISAAFSLMTTDWKDMLDKGLWRRHTDQILH